MGREGYAALSPDDAPPAPLDAAEVVLCVLAAGTTAPDPEPAPVERVERGPPTVLSADWPLRRAPDCRPLGLAPAGWLIGAAGERCGAAPNCCGVSAGSDGGAGGFAGPVTIWIVFLLAHGSSSPLPNDGAAFGACGFAADFFADDA